MNAHKTFVENPEWKSTCSCLNIFGGGITLLFSLFLSLSIVYIKKL
jgi:hypothetical protein